jgi:tetratricopeptide (TPR) repeat protein
MSFGGSAQAANQSLRYNRAQLKGRKTFEKLKEQYNNRITYHQKVHHKDVSPEDLARIRIEISVWARKRRMKQSLAVLASIVLFLAALSYFYLENQAPHYHTQENSALIEQKKINENLQLVKFYADDAQYMMTKEKYHNANFQYQKAIELIPTNTMANVGLVFSLTQLCVEDDSRCNEIDIIFKKSYKRAENKDLFLDELFKLSLSADTGTKVVLQELLKRVSK